jgi:phosphomevalonate kinase
MNAYRIEATAPGKLVLTGEYAVVYGHPAVVYAVNRRLCVTLRGPGPEFRLSSPTLGIAERPLTLAPPSKVGADPNNETLVDYTLRAFLKMKKNQAALLRPCHIEVDSSEFYHAGQKLGFGSSAALCVALWACLHKACGAEVPLNDDRFFRDIQKVHSEYQGGHGSGVDIAASLRGGVQAFYPPHVTDTLSWGRDLRLLAVYTGQSASTAAWLKVIDGAYQGEDPKIRSHIQHMGELAHKSIPLFNGKSTQPLFDSLRAYHHAMEKLGTLADLPLVTPAHQVLARALEARGGIYKVSGAGGGDMGVYLSADDDLRQRAVDIVTKLGFKSMLLEPSSQGIELICHD